MNNVTVSGRICNVPKIRILNIDGVSVTICNFTIATMDSIPEDGVHNTDNTDFIECVCFDKEALVINANFIKGSKINGVGKIKNHFHEDCNGTKHFTQILVLTQVEYADSASVFDKNADKRKAMDLSILSNLDDVLAVYRLIVSHGYLCLDEDEYYRIAMSRYTG